jgi:hypothetical protein
MLSTEVETDTMKIMFLHPKRLSLSYMYPTRLDILQVPRQRYFFKKVDLCTATGRTYTVRTEGNDRINKKLASFHK